ncbi:MAG: hypothetical protein OHK93_006497 [Ramalina farinacea]|uniref:Survival Motor Neuron Gemin2-binding domain-containing protein n=1 Tax=Ramalina farinacea TaxID=258253 RepID=A0AA43QIN3_9LECA|nr:hypothetical protein [Ramalina farinacea]
MGKSRKNLTHAEIWDDTALVQSWEEALKEYKVISQASASTNVLAQILQLYHSIHAKGERVEDVIKEMEENADGDALPGPHDSFSPLIDNNEAVAGMDEDLEEGEFEEKPTDACDLVNGTHGNNSTAPIQHEDMPASNTSQIQPPSISVPTAALNGGDWNTYLDHVPLLILNLVNNDAIKNLMLSWYWAGYYTGLHEGQQQATPTQNGNA